MTASRILGTKVRQRLPSRPAALLLVNDPWYPLSMWLGGPQSRCERFTEEKNRSFLESRLNPIYLRPTT
jgi:hypothetical protein